MIGPSSQQKVDPLHTAAAETQRLISVQDELTIAGLCKGIDTTESENKSRELRVVLEGMKALDRRRADSDRSRAIGVLVRRYEMGCADVHSHTRFSSSLTSQGTELENSRELGHVCPKLHLHAEPEVSRFDRDDRNVHEDGALLFS